jgi:hypothetical protein
MKVLRREFVVVAFADRPVSAARDSELFEKVVVRRGDGILVASKSRIT